MNFHVTQRIPDVENFLRFCERLHFRPRSIIFNEGDPSDSLFLILDGSVSVMVDDHEEPPQEMVVSYLNPGDFVGEMGLFGEEHRTATLVARTECELAKISYDRFHQVRSQAPELLYALTQQVGHRLAVTTRKLADLAFVDVYGRIHKTINQLTEEPDAMTHPDGMQIRITRQELGKLVGCSREMAGRVLKSLEEEGFVDVSGKTIVVLREPKPRDDEAPRKLIK
ncbi:MAG: cAMP-activated global transcriptional regulator CRP [Halieaceae bacterium]|jgi:CRP/FNR family cyclic AMP-dependent transcriptional regulator|nr:cAMP-activated global transcriptional regulator CRP [Halieaceae bacterium]